MMTVLQYLSDVKMLDPRISATLRLQSFAALKFRYRLFS